MGNGTVLIYGPIIAALSGRTGGNASRWDKQKEEGLINREGRLEKCNCKTLRSRSQHCALILMFILSEVAGVPCPQPCKAFLARSRWLCGSPRDNTVMKPDGNNTDHQRKPSARNGCFYPSSLGYPLSHNIHLIPHPCPAGSVCLGTADEGK